MVDDVPRVLAGRYEVGELIGRGGMAEVHIGRDNRLGRTVAVKILRADLARDPSFQARFRREAQSAASLNHPAIVSVYDTGEQAVRSGDDAEVQVPFIVMEYVEGHTVRDLLRDGSALPIEEAIEITMGVLTALEYSHHASIVHRDIKPANVMLTPTGAVKVMDFGIARAMADSSSSMTQTQAVIGTAQYLSPEQARGEVVDTRSDLYSTGCLLYELLTGKPPFEGDSAVAVAYQHVSEAPQPPSVVAPDVPEALDRIVIKALAKDRDTRYSTAAEFRSDLEAAARDEAVTAPAIGAMAAPAAVPTQVLTGPGAAGAGAVQEEAGPLDQMDGAEEDEPRSNKALVWILVIVALLAAAGIGYLIWDRANQEEPAPPAAVVPDLEGMDEQEVRAALAEVEPPLQPNFEYESHDEIPEGITISWSPDTGEEMPEGETVVEVLMSSGPDSGEIPDVSGLTQSRARDMLEGEGFENIRTETRNEPRVAEDIAIGTDPPSGDTVGLDTEITLILGTGNVDLEDMTGESIEAFREHIEELNLSYREHEQEDDGPPGIILSQDRSGTVPQNTTVVVYVSVEAPPDPTVAVPDLDGMTEEEAEEALDEAGLEAEFESQPHDDIPEGSVISWDPDTGTQIGRGETVVVQISSGPEDGNGNDGNGNEGNGNEGNGEGGGEGNGEGG
ncbi:Stk1 family PASTA domain-containing Ser/Thr kinase [Pseudactinotalea sp. Z1739]|uniref:Stk1 family PASTA domain-containing Ser/Thr kinase n=1 Tax=Pseudactinotalea sp. Z1739 TaxID=3413028 RepID=UPI003C7D24CF